MAHQSNEVTSTAVAAGSGMSGSGVSGTGPAATGTAAPPYPPGTSAEQIRRDIERTRAEMDKTVDVLQERLRPRHLLDDALDALRGWSASNRSPNAATANNAVDALGQVGGRVVESLRENPMPAALIGAGVAWLLFGGGKPSWPRSRGMTMSDYTPRKWDVPDYSGSYVDARTGQPYTAEYGDEVRAAQAGGPGYRSPPAGEYAAYAAGGGTTSSSHDRGDAAEGGGGPGMLDKAKQAIGGAAESVKESLAGTAQSARDAASSAGERLGGWAGSARGSAGYARGAVGEYASSASDQARYGYQVGRNAVEHGVEEYPLAMGAAAMAIGVLSGLLLPATRTEDRWMGDRADGLKDTVKDVGQAVVETGKQVASAAADAAADEAGSQDVSAGSLAEKVRHIARDVKAAAVESAEREGLDPDSLAQKGRQIADRAREAARDTARDETQRQKDQVL